MDVLVQPRLRAGTPGEQAGQGWSWVGLGWVGKGEGRPGGLGQGQGTAWAGTEDTTMAGTDTGQARGMHVSALQVFGLSRRCDQPCCCGWFAQLPVPGGLQAPPFQSTDLLLGFDHTELQQVWLQPSP